MNSRILISVIFLSIIFGGNLSSQTFLEPTPVLPLKAITVPMFGKDIVVKSDPDKNQNYIAMCSAFNGWLPVVLIYQTNVLDSCYFLESTDNGMSWEILANYNVSNVNSCKKLCAATYGNSISDLWLFIGITRAYKKNSHPYVSVYRYKLEPFAPGGNFFDDFPCRDITLASDVLSPASGSNPNSLGVLYSKPISDYTDSVIFRSSSNGIILDSYQGITKTSNVTDKVGLSFGSSLSYNSGRYFAVWQEQETESSATGHIYYAHTEPNFNSPFTKPVCIDSLDPSNINLCRNPVISCQYGQSDNDSSNFTTIILFEKFNPSTGKYDIKGYYNKKSTIGNNFLPFSFTDPTHYNIQPDIAYNPYDKTFIITWFDSTSLKLPYIRNTINLTNPNNWEIVSAGYNDEENLLSPTPKVVYNPIKYSAANLWISKNPSNKGVVLFDACYSTYTGTPKYKTGNDLNVSVYPNPCSASITFEIETQNNSRINVHITDILGQTVRSLQDQYLYKGKNLFTLDVSDMPAGNYIYSIMTKDTFISGKLLKIK